MLLIEKYGGTSLNGKRKMQKIAKHVKRECHKGHQVIIVVSAFAKETNRLWQLANHYGATSGVDMDALLVTGEQKSAALLSIILKKEGLFAICQNAWQLEITAWGDYQNGYIKAINMDYLLALLKEYQVIVITGFQGILADKTIVTLGRGGSDTTALALLQTLTKQGIEAKCTIYTDVNGVYAIDPKVVKTTAPLSQIENTELMALCECGNKIMSEKSLEIANKNELPFTITKLNDLRQTSVEIESIERAGFSGISFCEVIEHIMPIGASLPELLKDGSLEYYKVTNGEQHFYLKATKTDNNIYMVSLVGTNLKSNFALIQSLWHEFTRQEIKIMESYLTNQKLVLMVTQINLTKIIKMMRDKDFING